MVGQPIPSALADATVIDALGVAHRLGDAWRERDVVLVFIRHFACIGCAEQIEVLRPRIGELATLGVGVVIVGSGNADQLAGFIDREHLDGVACFTDPERAAYRAAGLRRSRWGTFGPVALGQAARAFLHGHRNGRPQGDLHQQGGTLYITRAGIVGFYHSAASLGDHARLLDVVDVALRNAAEASA
jgi:peroxiredoxin